VSPLTQRDVQGDAAVLADLRTRYVPIPVAHALCHGRSLILPFGELLVAERRTSGIRSSWETALQTLPPEQSLSLLRFRCSTTVDLGPDQWPFYDHYAEPRG
jgi:hypothetical protein